MIKLKAKILKHAKMGKNKPKDQPKFIYYRFLKGVQNLFNGIVESFRFRWKKERNNLRINNVKNQRLLFPESHPDLEMLELTS